MDETKQYLVVLGVPSIKKYVFGTDRLKEIRGASALLDDLNQNKMEAFFDSCPELDSKPIFTGGGAGQFIIKAVKNNLERRLTELSGMFHKETRGGLRLSWGMAELDQDYQTALKIAEIRAKDQSDEHPFHPFCMTHTGYFWSCDSCSGVAAPRHVNLGDKERLLCQVCQTKYIYSDETARLGFGRNLQNYLETRGIHRNPAQSFKEIGDQCSARKGYTALVYADGNSMGKLIKTINDPDLFKFFSQVVDASIKEACHEAIYEACFEEAAKQPSVIPAEILMLGGDDLLVYLTAEAAFAFAIKAAEKFSLYTREKIKASSHARFFHEKLNGKGLTISFGIAYGKSHSPFSILLGQAEELLKSAKKAGSASQEQEEYYSPSFIDYHLSSSYNQIRVKDSRLMHLQMQSATREEQKIKLYRKPYSLKESKRLLKLARQLKSKDIPTTRLRRLGNAPSLGKINGTLECLKLYTRSRKEHRAAIMEALAEFNCLPNMPWDERSDEEIKTVLTDLIEIAEFCSGKDIHAGDNHAS